jgi:aryl-alcohol dehydrogenase-like predicted oxidoreductase
MKNKDDTISRRRFLKQSSIGLAAASGIPALARGSEEVKTPESVPEENKCDSTRIDSAAVKSKANEMPRQILGKTGLSVSMLAFGGGSQFMKNESDKWQPIVERAIEAGINLFDTCWNYGGGDSEVRFGESLNKYRDKIYVCTKLDARGSGESKEQFEGCLKRLKMDYVDILFIHAVGKKDDLKEIENGVYKEMLKFKDEGTIKFIGIAAMKEKDMPVAKSLIEKLDIDVFLGIINPMKKFGNCTELIPLIIEKNIGLIAMKTVRGLVDEKTTAKELITYALDKKGVNCAVVGHHGIEKLEENITIVKEYAANKDIQYNWRGLEDRLEKFAQTHTPVWSLPGYHDGMLV